MSEAAGKEPAEDIWPESGGCLVVVATPIGNRRDFAPRGREALRSAQLIACEDTRALRRLMGEEKLPPAIVYADHNEKVATESIVRAVEEGQRVALISEAGTPTISDPGFRLVRACRRAGLKVVAVPGPAAAMAALSVSGLPSDAFLFLGFLPPRSAPRQRILQERRQDPWTLLFYESPHRIESLFKDILATLGPERTICVARELTKRYETVHTGPAGEVIPAVLKGSRKGEFVVLIAKEGYAL